MIEALKAKQSLKAAELQDGDIICFQKTTERKGDRNLLEKKLGLGENKAGQEEV
jgi:ubiquitin carboxyl-terminal hydrolase 7